MRCSQISLSPGFAEIGEPIPVGKAALHQKPLERFKPDLPIGGAVRRCPSCIRLTKG